MTVMTQIDVRTSITVTTPTAVMAQLEQLIATAVMTLIAARTGMTTATRIDVRTSIAVMTQIAVLTRIA